MAGSHHTIKKCIKGHSIRKTEPAAQGCEKPSSFFTFFFSHLALYVGTTVRFSSSLFLLYERPEWHKDTVPKTLGTGINV